MFWNCGEREHLLRVGQLGQPACPPGSTASFETSAAASRADLVDLDVQRHGALADEQRAERVQHELRLGLGQRAQRDQRRAPGGRPGLPALRLAQLGCEQRQTSTGGSTVSRSSPQVMSKSAEISKKKNEIEPLPVARQGVGPGQGEPQRDR